MQGTQAAGTRHLDNEDKVYLQLIKDAQAVGTSYLGNKDKEYL